MLHTHTSKTHAIATNPPTCRRHPNERLIYICQPTHMQTFLHRTCDGWYKIFYLCAMTTSAYVLSHCVIRLDQQRVHIILTHTNFHISLLVQYILWPQYKQKQKKTLSCQHIIIGKMIFSFFF